MTVALEAGPVGFDDGAAAAAVAGGRVDKGFGPEGDILVGRMIVPDAGVDSRSGGDGPTAGDVGRPGLGPEFGRKGSPDSMSAEDKLGKESRCGVGVDGRERWREEGATWVGLGTRRVEPLWAWDSTGFVLDRTEAPCPFVMIQTFTNLHTVVVWDSVLRIHFPYLKLCPTVFTLSRTL